MDKKSLDLGIWLGFQIGMDRAERLMRLAQGGDASARSELENCMIKFLDDPVHATRSMEEAGLLDVEFARSDPLYVDWPKGKPVRGRPPIRRVAAFLTSRVVGKTKKGRPPTGGRLRKAIEAVQIRDRPTARQVLRDLIKDWRAAEVIPTLSDEEYQTLRPFFGSIVGKDQRYTMAPPDFRVYDSGDGGLLPVFLDYSVHRLFWRCIVIPDPPTRSADCLIGELIGKSPDQVSRAAGTGVRTRSGANVRRAYLERSGIRILLEVPCEIDEVKWDQAIETAGHIIRRYNTVALLERVIEGVDSNPTVLSREIEEFWYRNMDRSWHITKRDETWGVIWIRKKRGKQVDQ